MQLSPSKPFADALKRQAVKSLLPTSLSSRELSQLGSDLLERAMFSARTTMAEHLVRIYDQVTALVDGKTDLATARLDLKQSLKSLGYHPEEGEEGTIKDLSSDGRTNLILRTNTELAQNYGQWRQGQDQDVLDQWPAQELVRWEDRKEKRNWLERWRGAGGRVFPGQGPDGNGRLVALKDDPVWNQLSVFGLPYPPFDFGSGMGIQDVSREDAMELGLIDRDTQVTPQERPFNDELGATVQVRDASMRQAILESVGSDFEFIDDVLQRKAA